MYLNGNLTQPHPPLFIKQSGNNQQYDLLQPTGPFFEWRQADSIIFACSPAKNVLNNSKFSNSSIFTSKNMSSKLIIIFLFLFNGFIVTARNGKATFSCFEGQDLTLNDNLNRIAFNEISCSSAVSGAIKPSNVSCGNKAGRLYNIGFEVEGIEFINYFQVCYDLTKSSAIYSQHQILGKVISREY